VWQRLLPEDHIPNVAAAKPNDLGNVRLKRRARPVAFRIVSQCPRIADVSRSGKRCGGRIPKTNDSRGSPRESPNPRNQRPDCLPRPSRESVDALRARSVAQPAGPIRTPRQGDRQRNRRLRPNRPTRTILGSRIVHYLVSILSRICAVVYPA